MAHIRLQMSIILRTDKTKMDLGAYHHMSLFSPVHSTLEQAIKNNYFTSWPGLTRDLIVRNLPPVLTTAKGYLNQEKQNIQSTKNRSAYKDQIKKIRNNIKIMKIFLP